MSPPRKYESHAQKQAAYRRRQAAAYQKLLLSKGLPPLPARASLPGRARWKSAIEQACCLLEQTVQEMQEYHDDRSERWQESERAELLLDQIDTLERSLQELQTLDF